MEPIVYVYLAVTVFLSFFIAHRLVLWASSTEELIKSLTGRHDVFLIFVANNRNDTEIVGGKNDGLVEWNLDAAFTFKINEAIADQLLHKINEDVLATKTKQAGVPDFPEDIK